MRFEFKLPDIGEGMVEGEIVKWHVKTGDQVPEDAPVLDVMTDKATVTISAPKSGKVLEIRAKEGEIQKVGTVLFVLETAESSSGEKPPSAPSSPNGGQKKAPPPEEPVQAAGADKVLASPATRRLAHELGVDLSGIPGSGPGGRIVPEDVRAYLNRQGSGKAPSTSPAKSAVATARREERVPLRGLRRQIAQKMTLSKTKIPHFTYVEECDVTELVKLREKAEAQSPAKNIRMTYLPFIIKAVTAALIKYPALNSVLDEERNEIVIKHYYNIGIGAATPEGLTVPVVKNADQKNIYKLAAEIQDLSEKARAGKLALEELSGSTFTITSLGALGGMFATPIINYPETAILGIHRIAKRPVVRDNQIAIRETMYVSLSFDHRVIDGDVGARFANEIIEQLQNPDPLMTGGNPS